MEQADKHQKLRELKGWFIGLGVVAVIIVGLLVLYILAGRSELDRKIAELKAQGIPTSFAELEAQHKLPAGTPNAADVYLKAFAAYRPFANENKQDMLPIMGNRLKPEGNAPYPQEEMDVAKQFIEANQAMYDLLHQAGQIPDCAYPRDFSSSGTIFQSDVLTAIKKAAQTQALAALYYAQQGQSQQAYDHIRDGIRLCESMSREPFLIDQLVQISIAALCAGTTEDCLKYTSFSAEQLQDLQSQLERLRGQCDIKQAFAGEICFQLEYCADPYNPGMAMANTAQTRLFRMSGLFERNILRSIESTQKLMAVDELPVGQRVSRAEAIDQEVDDLSFLYFLTKIGTPSLSRVYKTNLRVRSGIDSMITGLAIERYRLAEKKLPETLEDLVPAYLPEVYVDPFDGKPLKYRQDYPGYRVWGVGEDGIDNGGQERDINDRQKPCDEVVRIYR
ncbi:MAG TPA: hypothetical protein PKB02_12360 [Anaerohalosphaeraceae bacterium]|nr:hypothetical protein [Anaerohalosphaeraceae bacterium]